MFVLLGPLVLCKRLLNNFLANQNRQSYSQLAGDAKISIAKTTTGRVSGRGRGRGETKLIAKDTNDADVDLSKEEVSSVRDTFKTFCIRFVRLNGILFTRTRYTIFPYRVVC